MVIIKEGDKVKWIKKMAIVPHPEGKTCREGKVLPVFRDKEYTGTVIQNSNNRRIQVRPDGLRVLPTGIDSYYDVNVPFDELTKI